MIYIEKLPKPEELLQCKREGIKDYNDLRSPVRTAIREQLYREQKGLCAYCMRRLKKETMQIEHYILQHSEDGERHNELSIDYHNMLGVCSGGKGPSGVGRSDLTCDQHRGNTLLTVDPLKHDSVEKIKYGSDGRIYSDDPNIDKDLDQTLNLNCVSARLKVNHKAAMESFIKSLKNKHGVGPITKAEWNNLKSHYYNGDKDGERIEYAGIILFFIEKKLRSAR